MRKYSSCSFSSLWEVCCILCSHVTYHNPEPRLKFRAGTKNSSNYTDKFLCYRCLNALAPQYSRMYSQNEADDKLRTGLWTPVWDMTLRWVCFTVLISRVLLLCAPCCSYPVRQVFQSLMPFFLLFLRYVFPSIYRVCPISLVKGESILCNLYVDCHIEEVIWKYECFIVMFRSLWKIWTEY